MNAGETIALLSVVVPAVGALLCLMLRKRRQTVWIVAGTAAAISVASVALFAYMALNKLTIMEIGLEQEFPAVKWLLFLLEYAVLLIFLYVGAKAKNIWVVLIALFDLGLSTYLNFWTGFGEVSPAIVVDHLSVIMILITSLIGAVIAVYALRYMRDDPRQPRFFTVILVFLAAMNGAMLSNDMLWFLTFWSITTLCSFLLIAHTGTAEAVKAARWALLVNIAGGAALIGGAALSYYYYDTLALSAVPVSGLGGAALLPLSLFAVGAFTKSAQMPFQSWLLGAMVAPTPVSALLHSATMVNLGLYLLIRLSDQFAGAPLFLGALLALVGGASFLIPSILGIAASNAKRVLAYSTIANLGLITMCVGVGTPLAITAAVILLLYHAISKALMFLAVGAVKDQKGSEDIEAMYGLRTTMPFATLAIFVGAITIVLPPFGMFASKWLISEAVLSFPFLGFVLAGGFASVAVLYFKWVGATLAADPEVTPTTIRYDPMDRTYKWTLGLLMVASVALSALIGPVILYLINPYVSQYFDLPVGTDSVTLVTPSGELPVLVLLVLVAAVFIGLRLLFRPGQEQVAKPYASGEDFHFEPVGHYYLNDARVRVVTLIGEIASGILVVAMVVAPILMEVL